ncbi:dynein axonemal heavy chain 2-like isoform X2 [Toxorhynchites rutilus septentrionalis]|uniref:dynein axonemal heavy chain 2-like isoform X2 n=1 Tax=Toxorhynchites rutilus septentrionalis TaxID=329112 RepID=UPI00247A1C5D|nr:dynein axonemal heavy chain 2-like isoform X2 [Toxorhynchites rutilus septentrionalis]
MGDQDLVADNVSDVSSFSDSSDEGKKVIEVVEEAIDDTDKPIYSEEDLETLVGFIRSMILLFDYNEGDFNEEVTEVIKLWLTNTNNPLFFIFYDGDILTASLAFPLCPFNDLMYFMREPDQLFNIIERFHDDIMFGTLHSDIEGSLLVLLEHVYGPLIVSNSEWSENVRGNILTGYNSFMTYLNELHYKLSGFTLLYVPREGNDMDVQEAVLNRSMIKRMEAVVIDWTSQIRSTLSDTQHFVPDDLVCPSDEYNFWIYRHEVLSAIKTQFEGPNIVHVLKILDLAQSLYIKPLRDVLADLEQEIEIAESNIPFLKLLVNPCFAIRTLDNEDDLCSQLIYVMHIIRFIGSDSRHMHRNECITKLFLYLSNEIVSCCMQSIDIDKILAGDPDYGIQICNLKINGCESYKIIYEEMLDHFKDEFTWDHDNAAIFNRTNALIQRLYDVLEICEAMLIFGKYDGSSSYKYYIFSCNNAKEYEEKCDQVEKTFIAGIEIIQSVSGSILDINNKEWYNYIADFREMLRNLDDVIENLLSNVFLVAENLEEKIEVLITLLNFFKRDNIKKSFMKKITDIWTVFNMELTALSKEVSCGINSYPSMLPRNSGQYTMLKIKFDRICRLKYLLERCRFFPQYSDSDDILSLAESCEKQVNIALKTFNDIWIKSINFAYGSWFHRNLICRSQIRPGLLECHIERRMLQIFDEAYFFKVLGATIPSVIDIDKNESTKQTFDAVIRIALYFNNVVSSISEKERIFFKPMIQNTERKLEPLRSKFTWDEDLNEYIDTFVVNVKELLDVIQIYKRENINISRCVENIYNLNIFNINNLPAQQLVNLLKYIEEEKRDSVSKLVQVYTETNQHIFTIYEQLGNNIRKMGESWAQYVQKIDKLFKAALFNSSFKTLESIHKILAEPTSPILSIEIILEKRGIEYQPAPEMIANVLNRFPVEVTSVIKLIPSMCQQFQVDSDDNFYYEFLENETYQLLKNNIDTAVISTIENLASFKDKWNIFRPFWSVNRTTFIEKFNLTSMTSEAFKTNIEKFEELLNQLSTQTDLTSCKCVEIDSSKLKHAITNHINDWQIKYIDYLKCVSYGRIIEFNNILNSNMETLSVKPMEVEDLKLLENNLNNCFSEIQHMEDEIHIIIEYFDVLEKCVSDILPEASNLHQNINQIWRRYVDYLNQIKEEIENYQTQFKLSIGKDLAHLKVNALEMLKMLDEDMPTSDDLSFEDAFLVIDKLMDQLESLEAQERLLQEKMALLGIEYQPLDAIIEIRRKLENMKLIWLLVEEWVNTQKSTFIMEYMQASINDITRPAESILGRLQDLDSTLSEDMRYPIYNKTRTEILDYNTTVSILADMKSSHLRDRHWDTIAQSTALDFHQDDTLCLKDFVDHEFHNFKDEFMKLCFAARKEYEIETELGIVKQEVGSIRYKIHRSMAGTYKIQNADECFRILKSNSTTLNVLMQSIHRRPFQKELYNWEVISTLIIDLLEILLLIESRSNMLHEIFRKTESSDRFQEFNQTFKLYYTKWSTLVQLLNESDLQNDVCHEGQEFLKEVEMLRKHFDDLYRNLNDLLDEARDACHRLFLVPDKLLIETMAHPTNVTLLQHCMDYCFENINQITIRRLDLPHKYNRWEISEVATKNNDNILLLQPILFDASTNVDCIVAELEQSLQDTFKRHLQKCLSRLKQNYFRRIESGWYKNFIHQACLKSVHIENTLLIRNALVQSDLLGKPKPLKMLRTMHNKLINRQFNTMKTNHSTRNDRIIEKKLNDTMILEINTRDVIEDLVKSNVKGLKNFEWLSQLRSYWNDETNTCSVAHMDSIFHYGFECKPSDEPIFMTPHTNRLILTITKAIRHRLVPYLIDGGGHLGGCILKQLSTEFAVFFVTLHCDPNWKMANLDKYINGLIKLRAWLCFSGVENLSSSIFALTNEFIRNALAAREKHKVVDLKKSKIVTKFQFFAITNNQSLMVTDLERSIMRPVHIISPDQELVMQNLLCSCGIQQYRNLAFLIKLFTKQIKEYLPNHHQLWTSARIQKAILCTKHLLHTTSYTENQVLALALQDEFSLSISENEKRIFENCVDSIFSVNLEDDNRTINEDVESVLYSLGMTPTKYQETKIEETLSCLSLDIPVIIIGGTCGGKTTILRTAMGILSAKEKEFKQYYVNPEALKLSVNGKFDNEMFEEILTGILESTDHTRKCLIFDTVVKDDWLKCVRSFQNYMKTNLSKIDLKNAVLKVIVETTDMDCATPAAVVNFAIIYIDDSYMTWKQPFQSWLARMTSLEVDIKDQLQELANQYLDSFFNFEKTSSQIKNINAIKTFCRIYESIAIDWIEQKMLPSEAKNEAFVKLFFFCCVWSIGSSFNEAERRQFDIFIREQIVDTTSSYPLKGNVFQYFIEIYENHSKWTTWSVCHIGIDDNSNSDYVFTVDTIPYHYLTVMSLKKHIPVIITSDSTVGKTTLIKNVMNTLNDENLSHCVNNLSRNCTTSYLEQHLRHFTTNIAKKIVYPKERKNLVVFLDDLHTVIDQSTNITEFLRQLIEYDVWYDNGRPQRLMQTRFVSAMRNVVSLQSNTSSTTRLLSKFYRINFNAYNDEITDFIFNKKIESMTHMETPNKLLDLLAPATCELVRCLRTSFPGTPNKPRYQFSLKTMHRIIHAFRTLSTDANIANRVSLLRLWIHECYRETWDLLDKIDYKKFYEIFNDVISKYYEATLHGLCQGNRSPMFCDILNEDTLYEDIRQSDPLIQYMETSIDASSESSQLVVHHEAIEHCAKLLRIHRVGSCHTIFVGEVGSGRETICQLTTLLINHKMSINESYNGKTDVTLNLLDVHSQDNAKVIAEKFEKLSAQCIHKYTICLLRVDERDRVNIFMLEILNNFITNGIVAGIHPCLEDNLEESETVLWENIRSNLHFVICAPIISKEYRSLLNCYPSLMTNLTTICMHSLMGNCLTEISTKFMRKNVTFDIPISFLYDGKIATEVTHRKRESLVQSTEDRLLQAAADAVCRIHSASKYEIVTNSTVLCGWYYELMSTFQRLLSFVRNRLGLLYKKFFGGIQHIEEATLNVKALQEQFEKQQEQIAEYQQELEEFITNIEIQTDEADTQSQEVEFKREKIGAEEVICKQLAAVAEADLEKAMPALNVAIAALDSLNKKDMNEIKSYSRPPVKVELVLNAVMILLGKEPTWAESKRQLGEQKFLDTLRNFDKNNIAEKTLKIIGSYVRNPELEPNKVGTVSKAAKSLILWVRAIENYGKVYRFVGPKIRKMEDARASLLEKQLSLREAERKMMELAEKLAILRKEYEIKMKCKEELEEAARQMALKLERARSLVNSLSNERERWMETVEGLQREYSRAIGDALLAAGSIVYFGTLPIDSRDTLKMQWKVDLEALELSFTENFSLFNFFYQPDDLQNWQDCGLPVDDFCIENATIVLNSVSRIPLAIDPQGEIQRWLLKLHIFSELTILRWNFNENISEGIIATAIREQKTILIYNMLQQNMHNFHNFRIAYKKVLKQHYVPNLPSPSTVKTGLNRSTSEDATNSLYLTSSEGIRFSTTLRKSINMVNFVFGLSGLEIKLLAIVVEHENPSLEERKEMLMRSIISNKSTLTSLEENILRILNESKVPLIENEELYETLQVSRDTAESITVGLEHAQHAKQDIESSREIYRPCATRAALLFLVVDDLKQFNIFYRFSLKWYLSLFQKSLEKSSRSQVVGERRLRIIDFHTYNVFRNICYALSITDQKMFTFCLCVHLLFAEEKISAKELTFLLSGAERVERSEQIENPCSDWICANHWDNITELDKLPGFRGIVQSFEEVNDEWKLWYLSSTPELAKLPENWERNLTEFQKYLVVRSLRLDRFEPCIIDFVRCNLGRKYVNFKRANLNDITSESSAQTPILLICRPKCNPWSEVQMLAKSFAGKLETKLQYLDMRAESIESFVYHLKKCIRKEKWLFMHDCHKSHWLLSRLDDIMDYLKTTNINSNFRWWLTTDERLEHFPLNILQASIKFMYAEPMGIKQTMKQMYEEMGEEKFKKKTKNKYNMEHKKLIFSLAFFHSLLAERKKFQTLGWINRYSFSVLDFQLSEKLLAFGLEKLMLPNNGARNTIDLKQFEIFELDENTDDHSEAIPWKFINNIILEVGYGTQITNKWDRRIFKTHCKEIFRHQLITVPECPLIPYDTSYLLPRDGNYQSYINYITKSLLHADKANVFGQNENANIKYLESQSSYMLQMLRKAQLGPSNTVSHEDKDETLEDYVNIKQIVLELLATLPVYLDYGNATKIVGTNKTSVDDCLLHEISAYNEILEQVKMNLTQLTRVLSGEHNMHGLHQELLNHIQRNQIPQAWICYPTNKFLSDWIIDLRHRIENFRKWTETGQLPTDIMLGLFIKPRLFMHSVLKLFAEVNDVPLAELTWAVSVFPTMKPMVRLPITKGFIGRGIYLENAGWDLEKQCLRQAQILEIHCPMPPIAFKPMKRNEVDEEDNYFCPCYYSVCRSEEALIFGVSLNTGDDEKETWIKFGTALLLTL